MNTQEQSAPSLAEVFASLGRSNVVKNTLDLMREKGIRKTNGGEYDRGTVYAVIRGDSQNQRIAEAFLEAAHTELVRRKQLREKAANLVQEAQAVV